VPRLTIVGDDALVFVVVGRFLRFFRLLCHRGIISWLGSTRKLWPHFPRFNGDARINLWLL
jgi:hypothetical protein